MVKLSLDARSEAWPGGIGASARPMSPAIAATIQTMMTSRIAVALFLIGQPTCSSPAM
jgi:acetyl-CoA carboxylase alpha subunit